MNPVQVARQVLELYWDYNIPVNIDKIAEDMGAKVNYLSTLHGGDDISGRFDIINGEAVCSVRNTDTLERQRFTLAHELGHFALNHGGGFRDNSASFNFYNYDQREVDANAFAGELLMPKIAVDYLIQKENMSDINQLAQSFQVSRPAMSYRLYKLGWSDKY